MSASNDPSAEQPPRDAPASNAGGVVGESKSLRDICIVEKRKRAHDAADTADEAAGQPKRGATVAGKTRGAKKARVEESMLQWKKALDEARDMPDFFRSNYGSPGKEKLINRLRYNPWGTL